MEIKITFRQMDSSEALKKYVTTKVSRLQKLAQQPITANVILSVQKQLHVAEVQITGGRKHSEAKEAGEQMYASIDKVVDKLERQLTGTKSAQVSKKRRSKATVRQGASTEEVAPIAKPRAAVKKKAPAKKAKKVVRKSAVE